MSAIRASCRENTLTIPMAYCGSCTNLQIRHTWQSGFGCLFHASYLQIKSMLTECRDDFSFFKLNLRNFLLKKMLNHAGMFVTLPPPPPWIWFSFCRDCICVHLLLAVKTRWSYSPYFPARLQKFLSPRKNFAPLDLFPFASKAPLPRYFMDVACKCTSLIKAKYE